MEAALKMCPLIENAFVYGDVYATELVALISPNQKAFEELSRQMDKNNMTIEEKCNDKQIESTNLCVLSAEVKKFYFFFFSSKETFPSHN